MSWKCMSIKSLRAKLLMLLQVYGDIPVCVVINDNVDNGVIAVPCNKYAMMTSPNDDPAESGYLVLTYDNNDDSSEVLTIIKLMEATANIIKKYNEQVPVLLPSIEGHDSLKTLLAVGIAEIPDNSIEKVNHSPLVVLLGHPEQLAREIEENGYET